MLSDKVIWSVIWQIGPLHQHLELADQEQDPHIKTSHIPKDSKPRTKSAHAGPSKASKIKDPSKSLSKGRKSAKAPSVKANIVIVVDSEGEQAVIECVDTTQLDQLPDLPPVEKILINQPNPQQNLPVEQPDQPNQLNLVPNQQNQLNNQENNQNLLLK